MCGRFNVSEDPLAEIFLELVGEPFPGVDNYNTAPTEDVWIVRRSREGELEPACARWWLTPYWSKEPTTRYAMFNAKSETLAKSRAFREPYQRRRCVVPVSGFYEWLKDKGRKLPYYICPQDGRGIMLAGLWDRWRNRSTDEVIESFTVVTTAVSPKLEFLHNRQPVMLSMTDAERWLDHSQQNEQLEPLFASRIPAALAVIPVSSYVGNARNKEPRCIEPIGAPIEIDGDE